MAMEGLTGRGFGIRLVAALVLVYATYNPTGHSFYHWALEPLVSPAASASAAPPPAQSPAALKVLVGLILIAGWAVFLQATRRSLGLLGAGLALAISASVIWLLISWHVFSASTSILTHIALVVLSLILAVGLSWSHITRKLSGQQDTDTVG
jgi:hypothetical protein